MRSVQIVLDVQGFLDDFGELIPKEIAWITADYSVMIHAIMEPPCQWDRLSKRSQVINHWLIQNQHGIPWSMPGISHEAMHPLFASIPSEVPVIYVIHPGAGQFLNRRDRLKIKVLDVSLRNIEPDSYIFNVCRTHAGMRQASTNIQCAMTNVFRAVQYLKKQNLPVPTTPSPIAPPMEEPIEKWEIKLLQHPRFQSYTQRQESFKNWKNQHMPGVLLALSGFFHTGEGDHVACYACGIRLGFWLPRDNVQKRHRLVSPDCFVAKRMGLLSN